MGHQYRTRFNGAQIHLLRTQHNTQQILSHIGNIAGSLTGQLVIHAGKHGDKLVAHPISRRFRRGAAVDHLLHLGEHKRIPQHLHVTV